ncbi:alpha-ribazole-5'-phosphate phosphatase [Klebsiella pneumoniae]|uniref:Alpha-ribazole-5'-phosphate phosphatase n=1 Tax=Klebsiella pneumoniae TaxID=573 RepID=A0A2X3F375_KLEPN|nr:alpha-ribazole-5'-phosphate phosphatase [Klebsiella pneumoniae]
MKLWLVRHGETEANVAGLYSGHAPTPLTPRGVAQARALGERLRLAPFDKVFCSELARTGTTADLLLGDRAIPRERHPALNEMFFGDWEMRHHRDLQREDAENYAAWCADWQHAAPTNGESFQNFARRVSEFIPTLTDCRHLDHLLIVRPSGRPEPADRPAVADACGGDVALSHCPWRLEPPRNPRRFHHPAGIK